MASKKSNAPAEEAPKETASPVTEELTLKVGDVSVPVRVATESQGDIFFVLGVRKSGSTLLNNIISFLAKRNGVNIVDIPGSFFKSGLVAADWAALDLESLLRPGNLYGGFRNFPFNLGATEEYAKARKIFMFRDPRDALVSQYFSDAYSHTLPGTSSGGGREKFESKRAEALQSDIDEWVLQKCGSLRKTLMGYADVLKDERCLVLRYEDYVFQKRRLAHKVVNHFGWSINSQQLEKLMGDIDVVPDDEDKKRFVRKVVPGDHIVKLKPETIRRLNNKLSEVMKIYDYY